MTPSQQYRSLAASLRLRSLKEDDLHCRAEWQTLANLYDRLAVQADQNGRFDDLYDPILRPGDEANGKSR